LCDNLEYLNQAVTPPPLVAPEVCNRKKEFMNSTRNSQLLTWFSGSHGPLPYNEKKELHQLRCLALM